MQGRRRTTAAAAALIMLGTVAGLATPAQADDAASAAVVAAPAVGLPDGVGLTPMAAGTFSASDVVIENKVVDGTLVVTGSNVTLRNVHVKQTLGLRTADRVVVEDSEVGSLNISGSTNVRVEGVEISGRVGGDGIHITSDTGRVRDVVVRDTWIHSPMVTSTSHYDGIQVRGVDNLTLDGVLVELGDHKPQYTAALFLEDANGGNRNVTVVDSAFLGGGYAFYSFGVNVSIKNSVFGGARWGHLYPESVTFTITDFTGNRDTAGNSLALGAKSFVVGTSPTGAVNAPLPTWFSDVSLRAPFAPDIAALVSGRIATGYPDGTFRPGSTVTREAMAAFLHRAAGSPAFAAPARSPFRDVPTSHPFYEEIAWLAAEGISTGTVTADGALFKPADAVSREAMAAFLHRFAGAPAHRYSGGTTFSDVPANHPFATEVAWLAGTGIAKGHADGTFRPSGAVSREAMAAFLNRMG